MFNRQTILKSKDFEANFQYVEVIIGVGKDIFTILENTHYTDTGRGLRQPLE